MLSPIAVLAVFLILNFHTYALASGLQEGYNAMMEGGYTTAYRILHPLALQGDPKAQTLIGYMHERGWRIEHSYTAARQWYGKAIAQGSRDGQEYLYSMDDRIERDFQAGLRLMETQNYNTARWRWEPLATFGHPAAQTNLGFLYAHGLGVQRSYRTARAWYHKAIAQNYLRAQTNLDDLNAVLEEKRRIREEIHQENRQRRYRNRNTDAEVNRRMQRYGSGATGWIKEHPGIFWGGLAVGLIAGTLIFTSRMKVARVLGTMLGAGKRAGVSKKGTGGVGAKIAKGAGKAAAGTVVQAYVMDGVSIEDAEKRMKQLFGTPQPQPSR